MKVRDILGTQQILTVKPDDDVGTAEQMMAWASVRHLPVVRDGRLVGVITERDVLRYEAAVGGGAKADRVDQVMTSPALTAHPDDDLVEAEERMLSEKLGCLPVVEQGKLVGLITTIDLLDTHVRERSEIPAHPAWTAGAVMVRNPVEARPDDSLLGAILKMADRNVRHLPVLDEQRHVVGMLSDRDVRARIGNPGRIVGTDAVESALLPLRVRDAMSTKVAVVEEDTPLSRIVDRLLDERVGALPVVDAQGCLAGIISYLDVMKVLRE